MKKLVRIELNIWKSTEPEMTIKPIVKETEAAVSIQSEHPVRYQFRKRLTTGSYPKSRLGEIGGTNPGIKFVSYVTESEDPQSTEVFRQLVLQMTDRIYDELIDGGRRMTEIREKAIKG